MAFGKTVRQSASESSNLNRPSNSIKVDKSSVTSFLNSSYSKVTMVQNCLQYYQHNFRSCKVVMLVSSLPTCPETTSLEKNCKSENKKKIKIKLQVKIINLVQLQLLL